MTHSIFIHAALATASGTGPTSWLRTIRDGGAVAYLILGLSVVALALVVMHLWQIRRSHLLPAAHVDAVDRLLRESRVEDTLQYCLAEENDSYFCRILSAGLTRYQQSAFGVFEVKDAIDEAGEDQTARLYRSTEALGVIGSIAPLLGLFGTVLGMVGAFESLSRSAATQSEALAANISVALVTTLLGLALAIPCVALFTYFRNRIDGLASQTGQSIERVLLHLESPAAAPSAPASAGAPARHPIAPTHGAPPATSPPSAGATTASGASAAPPSTGPRG
ncbi:MAG: MotA/TolQ/ExbB proton channel family protein [Phycisphaerales bacterium]